MLDKLLQEDLDAEGEMYLGALTCLVEAYEEEHEPALDVSEADVLRELMRANGLTQRARGESRDLAIHNLCCPERNPVAHKEPSSRTLEAFSCPSVRVSATQVKKIRDISKKLGKGGSS